MRARLVACAIALLVCQLCALAAAPFALCRAGRSAAIDGCSDECCRNMAPGQVCPMHRHDPTRSSGPALQCECGAPDAPMVALVGLAGVLPPANRSLEPPANSTRVLVISFTLQDGQPVPLLKPPRA